MHDFAVNIPSQNSTFQSYHVIVLDTHIEDIPVTRVAKKIIDKKPDQQIIFAATLTTNKLYQPFELNGRSIVWFIDSITIRRTVKYSQLQYTVL